MSPIPRHDDDPPPPSEPTPTPRTPRSEPDTARELAKEMNTPETPRDVPPLAPLDVRVTRLEVGQKVHGKQIRSLTSNLTTLHAELTTARTSMKAAVDQLDKMIATYDADKAKTIREFGVRATQDSLHDQQHAEHLARATAAAAELVEVKRRLSWRQVTQEAASRGVAGGLVFGAGVAWHELWPLLVELAKKATGH